MEMTKGEKMVRVNFNATGDSEIDRVKKLFANQINMIEDIKDKDLRIAARTQTYLEDACMNYVKLLTA